MAAPIALLKWPHGACKRAKIVCQSALTSILAAQGSWAYSDLLGRSGKMAVPKGPSGKFTNQSNLMPERGVFTLTLADANAYQSSSIP